MQYYFYKQPQLQHQILDNNDSVFWQSRIQYNPCNCENLAYLEWESEVGTTKGWFFEILDTQKKTINSTSLQKISNDFDVRKCYELYFKLQKDNNSITKEEYNILKSLKDGFRYIGRINDNLFIINIYQNIHFGSDAWQTNFKMFNHLFKFVKNGDRPILISDILNRDVI